MLRREKRAIERNAQMGAGHLAALALGVTLIAGCAETGSINLPVLPSITTGSLPNPVTAVTEQLGEMASASGLAASPAEQRIEELLAIDRRCYRIKARDEVWRTYRAEVAAGGISPLAAPPVGDPWSPENREFFRENCSEKAQAAHHQEMRELRL